MLYEKLKTSYLIRPAPEGIYIYINTRGNSTILRNNNRDQKKIYFVVGINEVAVEDFFLFNECIK